VSRYSDPFYVRGGRGSEYNVAAYSADEPGSVTRERTRREQAERNTAEEQRMPAISWLAGHSCMGERARRNYQAMVRLVEAQAEAAATLATAEEHQSQLDRQLDADLVEALRSGRPLPTGLEMVDAANAVTAARVIDLKLTAGPVPQAITNSWNASIDRPTGRPLSKRPAISVEMAPATRSAGLSGRSASWPAAEAGRLDLVLNRPM
jgi:hypothetical protein